MQAKTSQFWLTGLTYLEGRRAMALHFSRLNLRRMARLPFFPSFFVSEKRIGFEQLKGILLLERKRFKIEQRGGALKVTASTFSGLNSLANRLFRESGLRPVVLRPERQFLLERNWGYFDVFDFSSGECFERAGFVPVPNARLGFFSEPFPETVRQLSLDDPELAERLVGEVAASNRLRIPLEELPGSGRARRHAMLENLFWDKGLGIGENASLRAIARSFGRRA